MNAKELLQTADDENLVTFTKHWLNEYTAEKNSDRAVFNLPDMLALSVKEPFLYAELVMCATMTDFVRKLIERDVFYCGDIDPKVASSLSAWSYAAEMYYNNGGRRLCKTAGMLASMLYMHRANPAFRNLLPSFMNASGEALDASLRKAMLLNLSQYKETSAYCFRQLLDTRSFDCSADEWMKLLDWYVGDPNGGPNAWMCLQLLVRSCERDNTCLSRLADKVLAADMQAFVLEGLAKGSREYRCSPFGDVLRSKMAAG